MAQPDQQQQLDSGTQMIQHDLFPLPMLPGSVASHIQVQLELGGLGPAMHSPVHRPTFIPNFPSPPSFPLQDSAMTLPLEPVSTSPLAITSAAAGPSPAIHGIASSYAGAGVSSLVSAFDTTQIPSRSAHSGSLSMSPPHTKSSPTDVVESAVPDVIHNKLSIIADKVQSASSFTQVVATVEAVAALRDGLNEVLDQLASLQLSSQCVDQGSPTHVPEQSVAVMHSQNAAPNDLHHTLKRPPSVIESSRDPKYLKREPVDVALPSLPPDQTAVPVPPFLPNHNPPLTMPLLPSIPSAESLAPLAPSNSYSGYGPLIPQSDVYTSFPQLGGSFDDLVHDASTGMPMYSPAWPDNVAANNNLLPDMQPGAVSTFQSSGPYSNPLPYGHSTMDLPLGRMSSSGSISGNYNSYSSSYQNGWSSSPPDVGPRPFPSVKTHSSNFYLGTNSPESDDEGYAEESDPDEEEEGEQDEPEASSSTQSFHSGPPDIQPEHREQIDRIFFEFLGGLCSDITAKDAKGVEIHQPLMPKKMQRLEESSDWRPFKFRIAAFTAAFLAEVARQGYPEETIPTKRLRQYLWRNHYLLRFNEEGKKAKSKGNHVWQVDSRKARDSQEWEYRPFLRKIAGVVPAAAYPGHQWSYSPRLWDAQNPWKGKPVRFSSSPLPSWLSWKEATICGVVPPDAISCEFVVTAKFFVNGQEEHLTKDIAIVVTPASSGAAANEPTPQSNRIIRPVLAAQKNNSRRTVSEPVVPRLSQSRRSSINSGPPAENQVAQVLRGAAKIVQQERQSLVDQHEPADVTGLCKQENVLARTLSAYSTRGHPADHTEHLARAGEKLVLQAAQTVRDVRFARVAGVPITESTSQAMQNVSIKDVTEAAQESVAQAVAIESIQGAPAPVNVMLTAAAILREQARSASGATLPDY